MAKSYVDWVKSLSHDYMRDYISRELREKPAKKLRVVCFPGAQSDEEMALEVKEVYLPMGILPKNILGVDVDAHRCGRLAESGLGIQVFHGYDYELFEQARNKYGSWDVISLDNTSYFTTERLYALELIAAHHLLDKRGVLITNYMAQRENTMVQHNFSAVAELLSRGITPKEQLQHLDTPFGIEKHVIGDVRETILRKQICGAFMLGKQTLNPDLFADLHIPTQEQKEDIIDFICNNDPFDYENAPGVTRDIRYGRSVNYRQVISLDVYETLMASGLGETLSSIFTMSRRKPYRLENTESYKYISNSGTPMLLDFFTLDRNPSIENQAMDLIALGSDARLKIYQRAPSNATQRSILKRVSNYLIAMTKQQRSSLLFDVERTFLGSSASRKEHITKEDALSLLEAGFNCSEIAETFRGFSVMQLAGFKAHMTRKRNAEIHIG